MVVRLTPAAVVRLPKGVSRFSYDRSAQKVGIVHIGVDAFHRAHQAWYTDRAMDAGDRNWAITGVSLCSRDAATQLNPQAGLFTVCERSAMGAQHRIVGSVRNVLPPALARVRASRAIAARETRIVSLTVSQSGYCLSPEGSIDFVAAHGKTSMYPLLVAGLRLRRDRGLSGVTILSCDNFAGNGKLLSRLLGEFCEATDRELATWIAKECTFPCSVVDRIVPATTMADYCALQSEVAVWDEAAVITEPFSQWVVEDLFVCGRPSWERVGTQMVADTTLHEMAKLRMLNGAHSALAYLGLSRGLSFVHEAVAHSDLRLLVDSLMRQEAASTIPTDGVALQCYADSLMQRFGNPGLRHKLSDIAANGSEKIMQRWLETLIVHGRAGRSCFAILEALAAWLRHVRGDHGAVEDPLARELRSVWDRHGREGVVQAIFGPGGSLASNWTPSPHESAAILEWL